MKLTFSQAEVQDLALRYVRNNMHLDEHFNTARLLPDGSIDVTWTSTPDPAAQPPRRRFARIAAWFDRQRQPAAQSPILMTQGATA